MKNLKIEQRIREWLFLTLIFSAIPKYAWMSLSGEICYKDTNVLCIFCCISTAIQHACPVLY